MGGWGWGGPRSSRAVRHEILHTYCILSDFVLPGGGPVVVGIVRVAVRVTVDPVPVVLMVKVLVWLTDAVVLLVSVCVSV